MVTALGLGRIQIFADGLRVLTRLPFIERWRSWGPERAAMMARTVGGRAEVRDGQGSESLRRAIGLVDRVCGANCYRRVLLEVALDREAARKPIYLGFRKKDGGGPGHAWLGRDADLEGQYEAVFRV